MEQSRPEQHRAVLAIRHCQAIGPILFQKCNNPLPVGIVAGQFPPDRRRYAADHHPAPARAEIGLGRRQLKVEADGGVVGMGIDGGIRLKRFERPGLRQGMLAQQFRKRLANFVGDLK